MAKIRKSFSVDVDERISEAFSKLCDDRGYTKYRAIEGAIRAFISLPDELQVALMKSRNCDVYTLLVHSLRDTELTKAVESLNPQQRAVLVQTAKELTKRLFPAKKVRK